MWWKVCVLIYVQMLNLHGVQICCRVQIYTHVQTWTRLGRVHM